MEILPGMKRIVWIASAALVLSGCQSATQRENSDLRTKVAELEAKAEKLEADNERLKSQVKLLTETTDNLTQVLKAQNALGTLPAASPTPTPTPK